MKSLLITVLTSLLTLPAMAKPFAAAPTTLAALKNHSRVLLVFSPDPSDARTVAQVEVTEESSDDLQSRDVFIAYISTAPEPSTVDQTAAPVAPALTPEAAAAARKRFHIVPGEFAVVLLGKDGGEKLRSKSPVTIEQLNTLIDSMPMRQQEMRDRNRPANGTH